MLACKKQIKQEISETLTTPSLHPKILHLWIFKTPIFITIHQLLFYKNEFIIIKTFLL